MALFHSKHDVPRRRNLHLESIDELAAEVDRIVAASRAGKLRTTGQWTAGQIFEHVAKLIEFSYDGFPFRARWPVRLAAHAAKWVAWRQFVAWALQPGFSLPANQQMLLPTAGLDCETGANRLRAALARICAGEPIRQPSPFEGRLTHDQWVYAHLRHAELHLSFIELVE